MRTPKPSAVTRDMFLVDVQDGHTGETFQTLSISRTPAMLLSFAANKFTEAAANYFADRLNLGTVDWRMLLLLARLPGITAMQSARTMGVDKGTVSRAVSRLKQRELICAGDLHANGRSRGLFLTPTGRAMHDQILDIAVEQHLELLKGFSPDEAKLMADFLLRFTKNLEAMIDRDAHNPAGRDR
jgi:DNA-binding MarR family transcriptional regulator